MSKEKKLYAMTCTEAKMKVNAATRVFLKTASIMAVLGLILAACNLVATPTKETPEITPTEPVATETVTATATPRVETATPFIKPSETIVPPIATATKSPEATASVKLNPEIYTLETKSMPEVDRRAFETAPKVYNEGVKAYSLRLRRVVYVNKENNVVGIFNTKEKFIADEYGSFFEGVQPATGFDNVMIVIMGERDQQFVLVTDYKDRTTIDKDGPEKLCSAMRAALASAHLFQKNKTPMPDKSTEWQTWTRGEGAKLFAKESKATAILDGKTVKLADPIIIVIGKDGASELVYKKAVISVDGRGFQFIGFDISSTSSSLHLNAGVSYGTFSNTYGRYVNMTSSESQSWYNSVKNLRISVSWYNGTVSLGTGSSKYDKILIQKNTIAP